MLNRGQYMVAGNGGEANIDRVACARSRGCQAGREVGQIGMNEMLA